jgi:hypothetical protein
MKQRDLFQLAPAVTTEGGTTAAKPAFREEPTTTPTWPEAKWDEDGELVFAE